MYLCYWNGGGYCLCELEVASLMPDSASCPNFEEDEEKEDCSYSTLTENPESER